MKRALVIGAGPGGLTAALAVRQAGFEPRVFDSADDLRAAGSGLTLWPNAMRALDSLGLSGAVGDLGRPLDGIAMRTWRGAVLFESRYARGGPRDWSGALHRAELQAFLLDQVGMGSVQMGARCVGYAQEGTRVVARFADGSEASGDLLVGADGLRSAVRAQLLGPEQPRYAGYTVWRGIAALEFPEAIGVTSMGRGSQFGYFPMSRGRVYWFASANAPEGATPDAGGHLADVEARFYGWHDPIPRLIEATDGASVLRTDIYDRVPVARWSDGRVTLLGDAAHPSVPTLGQGACQAMEDAAVLRRCLAEREDVPAAVRAYEAARHPRANAFTRQARRIGEVGQWESAAACWLRDLMIRTTPEPLQRRQFRSMFEFTP